MSARVAIGLSHEGHELGLEFSLAPLQAWWKRLAERNARSRALDEGLLRPAVLRVRVRCPSCRAGFVFLTALVVDGEYVRACRRCHVFFAIDV